MTNQNRVINVKVLTTYFCLLWKWWKNRILTKLSFCKVTWKQIPLISDGINKGDHGVNFWQLDLALPQGIKVKLFKMFCSGIKWNTSNSLSLKLYFVNCSVHCRRFGNICWTFAWYSPATWPWCTGQQFRNTLEFFQGEFGYDFHQCIHMITSTISPSFACTVTSWRAAEDFIRANLGFWCSFL